MRRASRAVGILRTQTSRLTMASDTSSMMTVSFRLSRRRLSLDVPFGLCAEFVAVEFTIVTAEWLSVEQRW